MSLFLFKQTFTVMSLIELQLQIRDIASRIISERFLITNIQVISVVESLKSRCSRLLKV